MPEYPKEFPSNVCHARYEKNGTPAGFVYCIREEYHPGLHEGRAVDGQWVSWSGSHSTTWRQA